MYSGFSFYRIYTREIERFDRIFIVIPLPCKDPVDTLPWCG